MRIKYRFVIQKVMGEYMAVAVGRDSARFHGMLRFNETGKSIFERLMKGGTEEEILHDLLEEYDTPAETLLAGIRKLTAELREANLLEE